MSKPRKDQPLKMPRYRGGAETLKQFIADNLKYPKEALENKIEGAVEVAYDVDGLGIVRKVRILSGLGYGCDEEVIRLINLLKYEKATNPGRNVTAHKKLKIDFKLPKAKAQPKTNKTQLQYHITPKKKPAEEKPAKKSASYNITVKWNKG